MWLDKTSAQRADCKCLGSPWKNPVPRAPAALLTHISGGVYNTSIQISKNIFKLISQKCTCDSHSLTTNLLFLQSPVCCQMETLSVQWLRPNTLELDPSFSHSHILHHQVLLLLLSAYTMICSLLTSTITASLCAATISSLLTQSRNHPFPC